VVGDILNRAAAVRTRLEDASPDSQLLDSLQPIWQVRLAGRSALSRRLASIGGYALWGYSSHRMPGVHVSLGSWL
jgi:hypothetical protein